MQWTRQQEILSERGQAILANQRMALVGTGGIGSHFALLAAHVGFRNFILVDPDGNQEENRNRSAREVDLGRPKVECLREQIQAVDSEISVATHPCKIQEIPEVLESGTVIASCADNWQARSFVNREAVRRGRILVDMGFGYANEQMGCHAALYQPGGACLLCGTLQEGAAPPSSASFLPTMMVAASLGMELLVADLTNYDRGAETRPNFLFYDAMERTLISLRRLPRKQCPVCSDASEKTGGQG